MQPNASQSGFDIYRFVRKRFCDTADAMFGPGFFSMTEYYFLKKTGFSPFAMLFSEPRIVYDEWSRIFKGEGPVIKLIRDVAGPGYSSLLGDIQRNDGVRVWNYFQNTTTSHSTAA